MKKERALAEFLEVYMLPATCVEYKLGRLTTRRISQRGPCRLQPKW
jgi:hypothetical protein